jgi:hypothetical protein
MFHYSWLNIHNYSYIFHDTTIKYPMKSQSLWLRPTLDIMDHLWITQKAESAFLRSMKSDK